jgi:hypothetical protein
MFGDTIASSSVSVDDQANARLARTEQVRDAPTAQRCVRRIPAYIGAPMPAAVALRVSA